MGVVANAKQVFLGPNYSLSVFNTDCAKKPGSHNDVQHKFGRELTPPTANKRNTDVHGHARFKGK